MEMENLIGTKQSSGEVLGKFLYFSLSNILIERGAMEKICEALGFPGANSGRTSLTDAFRSATGDIYERIVTADGIYKVYCRDNKRADKRLVSRELVKETLGESTNRYRKLANINYDKDDDRFECFNIDYDFNVDIRRYCDRAEELFTLYRRCLSRGQIETIIERYIHSMNALKISVNGKLFFVPKSHMHMVELLEDFIDALNKRNLHDTGVTANSMFVVDDAKQREKMASEFYANVRREIEQYQERISYLIKSGSESRAIMDRWVNKIAALEVKKQTYEEILKRELADLDDDFAYLKLQSQELQVRAKKLGQCA
jgi:hypothetical protein